MEGQKMTTIDKYYLIATLAGNNIKAVAMLLELINSKPKAKIIHDLEILRLDKYENEFETILDIKTGTIKEIGKLFDEVNE